jgi:hypothetical protein
MWFEQGGEAGDGVLISKEGGRETEGRKSVKRNVWNQEGSIVNGEFGVRVS